MDEHIRWQNDAGDVLSHKLGKAADELNESNTEIRQVLRRILSLCSANGSLARSMEAELTKLIRRTAETADRLERLSIEVGRANETFAMVEQQQMERARRLTSSANMNDTVYLVEESDVVFEAAFSPEYDTPLWLFSREDATEVREHISIELSADIMFAPYAMPTELSRYKL